MRDERDAAAEDNPDSYDNHCIVIKSKPYRKLAVDHEQYLDKAICLLYAKHV